MTKAERGRLIPRKITLTADLELLILGDTEGKSLANSTFQNCLKYAEARDKLKKLASDQKNALKYVNSQPCIGGQTVLS